MIRTGEPASAPARGPGASPLSGDAPAPAGTRSAQARPAPSDAIASLACTELLAGLDADALEDVAREVEWLTVHGGSDVCRQGEPGGSLFLVVSGKLRVVVADADGREHLVRELGRGENVGEMSLLTGEPRSATVRAVRDTVLARLTSAGFERLVAAHPATALSLTRMLARWLNRSNERRSAATLPATIAVRAASTDVPLSAFCTRLTTALGAIGPTLHLRSEQVDAAIHDGAADEAEDADGHARVAEWLAVRETEYQFVLYETAPGRTGWNRRCCRQADRIIDVAAAGSYPVETTAEPDPGEALTHLVMLHSPGTTRPSGTSRWQPGRYHAHHHVRVDRPADYDRLARHLSGRAVGLVLGGGGARGFAHIGVVKAMRELGIPVDRIGGTSMGAIIGGLVALEMDCDEMLRVNRDMWLRLRPNREFTLPLISLVAGRRGKRLCDEMFEDLAIEDLWIPYFSCSANLSRSRVHVHHEGSLARAALASVSIPGIAPPTVTADGDLLVDGGVLNNLPADVMAERSTGPVVAVNVSPKQDLSLEAWGGSMPTPRRVLGSRLRPFRQPRPYPSIFHVITHSTMLGSFRHAQLMREKADVYLEPPVGGYDLFGWHAIDELAEIGYRHAMEKLGSWPGLADAVVAHAAGAAADPP